MEGVHVVTEAAPGWILRRIAEELCQRLGWTIDTKIDDAADVNYFVNYALYDPECKTATAAFFTHPEDDLFWTVAEAVQLGIHMAPQYAEQVEKQIAGARTHVCVPGIDSQFTPRLRIGVCGRRYATGRKGDKLVAEIVDRCADVADFVLFHQTWSGIFQSAKRNVAIERFDFAKLPAFYRSIDFLLVPGSLEGGPMPVGEAIACGTEVIAPPVGNVEVFDDGTDDSSIVWYETGNAEDLETAIRDLWEYRHKTSLNAIDFTWENFCKEHDFVFDKIFAKQTKE